MGSKTRLYCCKVDLHLDQDLRWGLQRPSRKPSRTLLPCTGLCIPRLFNTDRTFHYCFLLYSLYCSSACSSAIAARAWLQDQSCKILSYICQLLHDFWGSVPDLAIALTVPSAWDCWIVKDGVVENEAYFPPPLFCACAQLLSFHTHCMSAQMSDTNCCRDCFSMYWHCWSTLTVWR